MFNFYMQPICFIQCKYHTTLPTNTTKNLESVAFDKEQLEKDLVKEIVTFRDYVESVRTDTKNIILDFRETPILQHLIYTLRDEDKELYLKRIEDYFNQWLEIQKEVYIEKKKDQIKEKNKDKDNNFIHDILNKHKNGAESIDIKSKDGSDVSYKGKKDPKPPATPPK